MAAVVERVLAGLDEDLLEYVTGLCEDTDDDADLAEAVAAFCLSSELCEEEDDAEAKAQELLKALGTRRRETCCGSTEAAVAQGNQTAGAERRCWRRRACSQRRRSRGTVHPYNKRRARHPKRRN